ncbi:MAG: hypothetical protein BWZ02_02796 [Lentisphaerae bacterium ADurb.BinA184]|nr:MAG: hypothetical protein BWZ02_02796 [Lentisphaerae bacterium ADurb.BinA184]
MRSAVEDAETVLPVRLSSVRLPAPCLTSVPATPLSENACTGNSPAVMARVLPPCVLRLATLPLPVERLASAPRLTVLPGAAWRLPLLRLPCTSSAPALTSMASPTARLPAGPIPSSPAASSSLTTEAAPAPGTVTVWPCTKTSKAAPGVVPLPSQVAPSAQLPVATLFRTWLVRKTRISFRPGLLLTEESTLKRR